MNRYDERLEKEAKERAARKEKREKQEQENQMFQQKMKATRTFATDLDGVPLVYSPEHQPIQTGGLVVITDGYNETSVLTNLRMTEAYALDGKRLKYTEPTLDESKNSYFLDGKEVFFDIKLSKNQVVLVNGNVYTIANIDKETRQVEVEKREATQLTTLYPVYLNHWEGNKRIKILESVYENWGDAYGEVLKKRLAGQKNYSL